MLGDGPDTRDPSDKSRICGKPETRTIQEQRPCATPRQTRRAYQSELAPAKKSREFQPFQMNYLRISGNRIGQPTETEDRKWINLRWVPIGVKVYDFRVADSSGASASLARASYANRGLRLWSRIKSPKGAPDRRLVQNNYPCTLRSAPPATVCCSTATFGPSGLTPPSPTGPSDPFIPRHRLALY
jgi:hypothetical protein